MDCNRDEATRARELAEQKFADKDFDGAKKFALKAQKLYPELDGLPQLFATIDVHISVSKRVNGVVDWYKVLGVEPLADDDTIRKHYRKLALILHPDKNKSAGAEGAFKIISEAWSSLSDKSKRTAYDQKRNAIFVEIPNWKSSSSVPTGENGFKYSPKINNLDSRNQKTAPFSRCEPLHFRAKLNTFWTTCNACKMHFEYLRTYLNNKLACPNCRQPFLAVETTPPLASKTCPASWPTYKKQQNQDTEKGNQYPSVKRPASATGAKSGPFSKSSIPQYAVSSSSAAQATHGVRPSSGQSKRDRKEAATAFMRKEAFQSKILDSKKGGYGVFPGSSSAGASSETKTYRLKKKRRKDERMVNSNEREMENRIFTGNGVGVSGSENDSSETGKVKIAGDQKLNYCGELSPLEIRNMLMNKAKKEIHMKLDECRRNAVSKTLHESKCSSEEIKDKKEERQKDLVNGEKADANKCAEFVNIKTDVEPIKLSPPTSDIEPDDMDTDLTSMNVPDPDFHDFDQDRTEMSFGANQVWAAYDEDDGMPRYYAMIQSVISLKPFKMRISWLNSKSNSELAPINWVASGFPKTSGDFWRGKYEVYDTLNSFSHKVSWAKGTRGAIQIYPRKGEVWALYRNWSADWNEYTPDEVIHQYDMVEVVDDYNEKTGATVVPLVKVPGFKTVFCQQLEECKNRTIPREEMFRFSHQVPSYMLTGQEGHNAPKSCLELDPASTPLELLQVLTESQLEEMKTAEKSKEEYPLDRLQNAKEFPLIENSKTTDEQSIAAHVHKKVEAEAMMNKKKETRVEEMVVYKRRR